MGKLNNEKQIRILKEKINELEKKNSFYENIFSNLPFGIQVFDQKGNSQYTNHNTNNATVKQILRATSGKFIPQENLNISDEAKHERTYEYSVNNEDGNRIKTDFRIIREKLVPIKENTNKACYVLAILEDITESEQMKASESAKEADKIEFLNNSPDITYRYSNTRGALFWSERVKDILGFSPDELKKDPFLWNNSIHPDDRQRVTDAIADFKKGHKYNIEYRIKTKQGKWIWLHDFFIKKSYFGNEIIIDGQAKEITNYKKTEQHNKESYTKFKTIFNMLNVGITITDEQGNIIDCNKASERILGITKKEHVTRNFKGKEWNIVRPDNTPMLPNEFAGVRAMKENKAIHNVEMGIVKPDGITWIRSNAIPLKLKNYGVLISYIEITESKNLELQLKAIKKRFDLAMNATNDGLWDWNMQTNEIYYSTNWKKMLGFSNNELPDTLSVLEELAHPNDFKKYQKLLKKHIADKKSYFELEFRMKHKNGSWIEVLCRANIYFGDNEQPRRMVGTHIDVTERKKAELERDTFNRNFEAFLKQTTDFVYSKDINGRFVFCSQALAKITGHKHWREMIGKHDFDVFLKETAEIYYEEEYPVFKEGKSLINKIEPYYDSQGKKRFVQTNKWPLFDNHKKVVGIFGISRDITDTVRAEKLIKESEKQLKQLNASKDRLFSIIAHDLRSPFNALLGMNELVAEKIDLNDTDSAKRILELIHNTSEHVLILLDNLLQWSRLQTSNLAFNPGNLLFGESLNNILNLLEASYSKKNISINLNFASELQVYADRFMLETIMRNLLSNAIKFTYEGGIIDISVTKSDKEVTISVTDNGKGIPKNKINQLLDIETNYTTTGTQKEKGTGLGLVLCKSFIEKHQGKIWVASKENEWTRITFTLKQ